MNTQRSLVTTLMVLGISLTGCSGDTINVVPLDTPCDRIEGKTFYSTTLGGGGEVPAGTFQTHWTVKFNKGQLQAHQYDYVIQNEYNCKNGQLHISSGSNSPSQALQFNNTYDEFTFGDSIQTSKTYRYYPNITPVNSCQQVRGQKFNIQPNAPVNADTPTALTFGSTLNDVVVAFGETLKQGHYVCDLGALHIHLKDHPANPIAFSADTTASQLHIQPHQNPSYFRVDPLLCNKVFSPVCAAYDTGIRCVTSPCPSHIYKTYSNECEANKENSTVLFNSPCGDLEGKPIRDIHPSPETGQTCITLYDPICTSYDTGIRCVTTPCPSHIYKTYPNSCVAQQDKASPLFKGTCDAKEGQPVN